MPEPTAPDPRTARADPQAPIGEARREHLDACYEAVFAHASEAILLADDSGRYVGANLAAASLTGFTQAELCAMRVFDLTPAPNEELGYAMWQQFLAQGSMRGDYSLTRKDGRVVEVEFRAVARILPGLNLSVMRDVTDQRRFERERNELLRRQSDELAVSYTTAQKELEERKRAEDALRKSQEQLMQAAKMEAVGRLSGGIAHDFNNLLSVVLGYADLAERELAVLTHASPPAAQLGSLRAALEQIKAAGQRAGQLTQQLLAFSRKQLLEPKLIDLNHAVVDTVKLLERLLGEHIELVVSLEPQLGHVKVDPDKISQVVMNLAVNARDAMPHGGTLTIVTENVSCPSPDLGMGPDPCVRLTVSDSGAGMDDATLARLFEPFFTTKAPGRGTGLGLATVYGIVQQSGGTMRVRSDLGHGSRFEVYLRSSSDNLAPELTRPSSIGAPRAHGSETILLVEDEDQVRAVIASMLELGGYRVVAVRCGREALETLERNAGEISLVLTDIVMPQMSGCQLVESVLARWPDMRILFMSGYTDDAASVRLAVQSGAGFVHKPLATDALLKKVRATVDAPRNLDVTLSGAGR